MEKGAKASSFQRKPFLFLSIPFECSQYTLDCNKNNFNDLGNCQIMDALRALVYDVKGLFNGINTSMTFGFGPAPEELTQFHAYRVKMIFHFF